MMAELYRRYVQEHAQRQIDGVPCSPEEWNEITADVRAAGKTPQDFADDWREAMGKLRYNG